MVMKTVNIKGKEYVEVNERVKFFIKSSSYEGWAIETEMLSNQDGVCVFKATIKDTGGVIRSTGHAYEKEQSSFINKTSYIENCETSAVGRALGFLGIGIDTSIASSDEVANAVKNQPSSGGKIDFAEVRAKIKKITTVGELSSYWDSLGLSEKQKDVLRADFNKRRVEIKGEKDGVE